MKLFRKGHARLAGRGGQALEWAEDVTGRAARVTALGSRCVLVENHTGIAEYTGGRIRLTSPSGAICVEGDHLSLREVRPGALIICGRLRRVDLPCPGGDPLEG